MTDPIRLADDQLQKIMAAILTTGGKYDHAKQVIDEVERLCDAVDGAAGEPKGFCARVGGRVKFLPGHWAVENGSVRPGATLRIERVDEVGHFWTEQVLEYPDGICVGKGVDHMEFLP